MLGLVTRFRLAALFGAVLVAAAGVLLCGVLGDQFAASLPYQDPTPEMLHQQAAQLAPDFVALTDLRMARESHWSLEPATASSRIRNGPHWCHFHQTTPWTGSASGDYDHDECPCLGEKLRILKRAVVLLITALLAV